MRMIISLCSALVLMISPFLELGTTIVNAQSINDSQLSLYATESYPQDLDFKDENIDQETEQITDEVSEELSKESSDEETEMTPSENSTELNSNDTTLTDESLGTTEEAIMDEDHVNESLDAVVSESEIQNDPVAT